MGFNGYHLLGLMSYAFAALVTYWLINPSPTLESDPLNSTVLIIFILIFAAAGTFLMLFSYIFTGTEED